MKKNGIVNDNRLIEIIKEELTKKDVVNMFKDDKDFEKRVKSIVSDVVVDMFRILWQHNGIFKTLGRS